MAEYASDSPASLAQGQTPPVGRRNNKHNRNRKSQVQVDGAVSDGALAHPGSPRSKAHMHKSSAASGAAVTAPEQNVNLGKGSGHRQRPLSYVDNNLLATPAKEQAYAGSTFQASPAASSLPMPKFSRSVPNAGARSSLSARLAEEKSPDKEQSSPEADVVAPMASVTDGHKSPLDLFFQADKAEKERSRSSGQTLSPSSVHHSRRPAQLPRNQSYQNSRGTFLGELDGDMPSPRTTSTNDERPLSSEKATSSPGLPMYHAETIEDNQARTQSLKDLLFQTANRSNSATPQHHSRTPSGQQTPDGFFGSPSPFQRSPSNPSTPQPTPDQSQNQYSLHYGNRNLSPLFKAARSDTPPRPSTLRQELGSDASSKPDSVLGTRDQHSPNAAARNYLNHTARASGPAEMPHLQYNHQHSGGASSMPTTTQSGASYQAGDTNSNPRNASDSRDIQTMEEDLRRMLKLNVLG